MGDIKPTQMLLKADLQCDRCYMKIKRLLCGCDRIRDQLFDEKQGLVRITVFCCSPEKIRQKLIRRGGSSIKSIEIVQPPPLPSKPKEAEKSKPPEKVEKSKPDQDKPKPESKPKDKDKPIVVVPVATKAEPPSKPKEQPTATVEVAPVSSEASAAKMVVPAPMAMGPMPPCYPVGFGYPQYAYPGSVACYYQGGYGMGVAAPPVYYDGYGRPMAGNCCDYFSEENPSTCSVM